MDNRLITKLLNARKKKNTFRSLQSDILASQLQLEKTHHLLTKSLKQLIQRKACHQTRRRNCLEIEYSHRVLYSWCVSLTEIIKDENPVFASYYQIFTKLSTNSIKEGWQDTEKRFNSVRESGYIIVEDVGCKCTTVLYEYTHK